jgi:hypothetical protein
MRTRTVGAATFWVPAFAAFAGVVAQLSISAGHMVVSPTVMTALFVPTWLLGLGLVVLFVRDSRRNPTVERRDLWTTMLVLANFGALPIYWWRHLRPSKSA